MLHDLRLLASNSAWLAFFNTFISSSAEYTQVAYIRKPRLLVMRGYRIKLSSIFAAVRNVRSSHSVAIVLLAFVSHLP
jgi:hypothetical protein